MAHTSVRHAARGKRHARLRLNLAGTAARPRLAVYRSLNHIYAQLIDDESGRTLAAASSLEGPARNNGAGTKTQRASVVGRLIGERGRKAGVSAVVFDRAGFKYHGRVKSLAEAAREAGLEF
jgi:large subunit ribosomal protein L18